VHSFNGWKWLVCVRFQDSGHRRNYAVPFDGDSHYAVGTDECGLQTYAVFDQMGGVGLLPRSDPGGQTLPPLH
jgi:hypothetical protein